MRFAATGIGLVGLGLCESIASITGTAIAIILGGVGSWSAHRAKTSQSSEAALRTWSRLVGAAVIAFAVVSALRPVDLPGSKGFEYSSAAIRLSVGYAGLEIFRAHPLVGVGWQQSSTEGVINAPSVVEAVEERFGDLRTYSEAGEGITSVHNMYVQFLAETGVIGCAVLLWVFFGLTKIVRRSLRAFAGDTWWASNARFLSLVLLLLVVWWNDNPLFGAQTESFLAAITIGLLAAAVRIGGRASGPEASEPPDEPVANPPPRRIGSGRS
jgi:O-antigen ligase